MGLPSLKRSNSPLRTYALGLLLVGMGGCSSAHPHAREDAGMHLDGGVGDGPGCAPFDEGTADPAKIAIGAGFVQTISCAQCHGAGLSGNFDGVQIQGQSQPQYPPNLTSDPATGLGCWTDAQIANAILFGVDNQNQPICPPMPHFSSLGLTMEDALAIAAYLRTLPIQSNQVPSGPACQPWGQVGGGCNTAADCPAGSTCPNQYCLAGSDMAVMLCVGDAPQCFGDDSSNCCGQDPMGAATCSDGIWTCGGTPAPGCNGVSCVPLPDAGADSGVDGGFDAAIH